MIPRDFVKILGVEVSRYKISVCNATRQCKNVSPLDLLNSSLLKKKRNKFYLFGLKRKTLFHNISQCNFQSLTSTDAEAFTQAFLQNSIQQNRRHDLNNMLIHKAVILGYTKSKNFKSKRNSKSAKGLNAQQKRAMKIFQINPDHQRLVRAYRINWNVDCECDCRDRLTNKK